jgi:MFS superfamily sulfate permease-like transporter
MQQRLRYKIPIYFSATFLVAFSWLLILDSSSKYNKGENKVENFAQSTENHNSQQNIKPNNWLTYSVPLETKFNYNERLQSIIDRVVQHSKSKQLPIDRLSITLIDLKTSSQASYRSDVPRYPASIVKLFWLVGINQLVSEQKINKSEVAYAIEQMILKSDNYGASQIIDKITQTKSTLKSVIAQLGGG